MSHQPLLQVKLFGAIVLCEALFMFIIGPQWLGLDSPLPMLMQMRQSLLLQ